MAAKRYKTKSDNVVYRKLKSGKQFYVRFDGREKAVGFEKDGMDAEQAKAILAEIKSTKERVVRVRHTSNKTVDELFEDFEFLPCGKGDKLHGQRSSWPDDKGRYKNHIQEHIGHKIAETIENLDVIHTKALSRKLSPQTVKHILDLTVRILKSGKIVIKAPKVKVRNEVIDKMPDVDYQALKTFLVEKNTQYARMLLFVMFTGLRRNNVCMAKWSDIDENNFLHLDVDDNKSGEAEKIKLNMGALEILSQVSKRSEYIFANKHTGTHFHNDTLSKNFGKLLKESKIKFPKNWRPTHSFRHVMATRLLSTGKVGLADIQAQLCHKSPRMTQRYAHIVDEARERIANISDEVL